MFSVIDLTKWHFTQIHTYNDKLDWRSWGVEEQQDLQRKTVDITNHIICSWGTEEHQELRA